MTTQFNATSAYLEWEAPKRDGGRSDLFYSLECQFCGRETTCEKCSQDVAYVVDNSGFAQPSHILQNAVIVSNLRPFSKYKFKVGNVSFISLLSISLNKHLPVIGRKPIIISIRRCYFYETCVYLLYKQI